MAEITVNPFGAGGELPTNIGIVNDLTTGGADKALSAGMGKHLGKYANVSYRGRLSDDINIFDADDFGSLVSGQRIYSQTGGIASVSASSDPRATFNKYFTIGIDGPLVVGTEYTVHLPAGYWVYLYQVNTTGQTTQDNRIYYEWMQDGGKFTFVDGYDYYVLNFAKGTGKNETIDLVALAAGFKISSVTQSSDTASASIEILGANGSATKTLYSDDDSDKVQVYSKSAVDAIVGGGIALQSIRVAAWNFGHFCLGISDATSINNSNYDAKLKAWAKAINEIGATILCATEFDPKFGTHTVEGSSVDENTNDVLMSTYYAYNSVGTKSNYNCNGIFGKLAVSNGATVNFSGSTRYYQKATVTIGGKAVTIVAAHLELPGGAQDAQLAQLITDFANTEYVIIAGDFNVRRGEEGEKYGDFATAGFKLANCGDFGGICTYPSTGAIAVNTNAGTPYPYKYLDNIIVKGFNISNVHIFDEGTLTDHCAIVADLTII